MEKPCLCCRRPFNPLPRTRRLHFAEACRYEKAEEIIFHMDTSRKIALMISFRRLEVRQECFL